MFHATEGCEWDPVWNALAVIRRIRDFAPEIAGPTAGLYDIEATDSYLEEVYDELVRFLVDEYLQNGNGD